MRVCFQLDHLTQEIVGAWWEIGDYEDQELACEYVEPLSMLALAGVDRMLSRPPGFPVYDWWQKLADQVSPLIWFEVAEVNDESYGYELLYKTWTCNPRPVGSDEPDFYYPFMRAQGWGAERGP